MHIEFINHSSFLIEHNDIRLICDPWLEGFAFDKGWDLLSDTKLNYEAFEKIDYIWFSHEHPDHFSPPNLFKIPEERRKEIKVIYQETVDKKVIEFCKKLGFKEQIELKENTLHRITEGFEIMCNPYTDGDSYALFKLDNFKLLNVNDCIVNTKYEADQICKITGEVDVLFTQFGYANKVGNTDDVALRKKESREKLNRIKLQTEALKPKYIVPFASFVYFCHVENKYMNTGMNTIDDAHQFIDQKLSAESIIMYPGDQWKPGEKYDVKSALENYQKDYQKLEQVDWVQSDLVPEEELIKNSQSFVEKLKPFVKDSMSKFNGLSAKIYVTDLKKSFILKGLDGLHDSNGEEVNCDVSMGSQALNYMFCNLWGGDTLNVNARFQVPQNGRYNNLRIFSKIASYANRGEQYHFPSFLTKLNKKVMSYIRK